MTRQSCWLWVMLVFSSCASEGGTGVSVGVDGGDIESADASAPLYDTGIGIDAPVADAPAAEPDAACGGESVGFDYRSPNLLVVLDRSCSMRQQLTGGIGTGPGDTSTRWYVAKRAVIDLSRRFETRAYWGLMAFPDPREGCDMTVDAEVPPGPLTADLIARELNRNRIQPWGLCGPDNSDTTTQPRRTPTADALRSAQRLRELRSSARSSFALLITDGGVSCDVSDGELRRLASSLRADGIPLAVVGFTVNRSDATLEALASRGGLPRPGGSPSFYVADDSAQLVAALDEIWTRVVSCELRLTDVPPEGSEIFVDTNGSPLAPDAVDGWTYQPAEQTIVLHGAACDRLKRGETTRIDLSYDCPPVCTPAMEQCNGLDDDCDDAVDEGCLM